MKGKIAWVVGLLVVAGLAGWYFVRRARQPPPPRFLTAAVERGRLVASVTATGTLSALVTVQVGSQVSGRIAEIRVDYNSPVKKGQIVAKIDPQLFNAALEQANANLLSAQGNLLKAKAQAIDADRIAGRDKELRAGKLIAQADADTAQANADVTHAQIAASEGDLAQARASLHQAQVNRDYTTIISPTDGVVISRSIDVGQTVAASFSAPVLFTIAKDLTKMQVDTNVAEADVGKLSPSMPVTFSVDAYPGEKFHAKVRQIRFSPTTVQNVVTYDAVIDVDNPEVKLRPGMTANVTFVYAERDDALKVPNSALRFRPPADLLPPPSPGAHRHGAGGMGDGGGRRKTDAPSDKRTVWVLHGATPSKVEIRIGISDGTVTEVLTDNLSVGDQLLIDTLSSGNDKNAPAGGPPGMPRRMF